MKKICLALAVALLAGCTRAISDASARKGEMVIGSEILPQEINEIMLWQYGDNKLDSFMYDMVEISGSYSLTAHYSDEDGEHMEIFDVSFEDWSSVLGALDGCAVDTMPPASRHVYIDWASRLQEDDGKEVVVDEQGFLSLSALVQGIAETCRETKLLQQNEDLQWLRQQIVENSALVGVACVEGYSDAPEFSESMLLLDHLGYIDAYSFLARMTEENFSNSGGRYLFLLVPLDEETRIIVEDFEGDATVFDRQDGKPLLVAAEGYDNSVVKVTVERGFEAFEFYLAENKEYGGFLMPNGGGVYDFTMPLGTSDEDTTGTIRQVQDELKENGYLAAEILIGNTGDIDLGMALNYLDLEGYLDYYPFLAQIDEGHFIRMGNSLIVLIPCGSDCLVEVSDMEGNVLYRGENGDPILLLAGDGPLSTVEVNLVQGDRRAVEHPREDFYNGGLYVDDSSIVADYTLWQNTELFQQAAFDLLYENDEDFRALIEEGRQWWYYGHCYVDGNECQSYWIEDDDGNVVRYYAVSGDYRNAYRYYFEEDTWKQVYGAQ